MKLTTTIVCADAAVEQTLHKAFSGNIFAMVVLANVVRDMLDVCDPTSRPAEFVIEPPIIGIRTFDVGAGVQVMLDGVGRVGDYGARSKEQLRDAHKALYYAVCDTTCAALREFEKEDVDIYVLMRLDDGTLYEKRDTCSVSA